MRLPTCIGVSGVSKCRNEASMLLRCSIVCLRRVVFGVGAVSGGNVRVTPGVGIDEAAQAAAVERLPTALGLREPVRDRVQHDRVVAEPAVAALDLDVFRRRTFALEAALPGDDAVAAAEDRRGG